MKRGKFNASHPVIDGIRFDSALEAKYYLLLKWRISIGDLDYIIRQVPFDLPGGIKYRADFAEFKSGEPVVYTDVKGIETKDFVRNKKQVEALYPVTINVIKKKDLDAIEKSMTGGDSK